MKIAIIFDADQQGGGGFYQSLRTIDLILKDREEVFGPTNLIIKQHYYLLEIGSDLKIKMTGIT